MVAVVRGVDDVRVVQLAQVLQLLVDPLHGHVHALQRLQALRHQQVREAAVHGLHRLGHAQDPLLVGIRGQVVGRSALMPRRGGIEMNYYGYIKVEERK